MNDSVIELYKKISDIWENLLNTEVCNITVKLNIDNHNNKITKYKTAFIIIKEHKEN